MQTLANPNGYCGLGGTGVSCPIGTGVTAALTLGARRSRPRRRVGLRARSVDVAPRRRRAAARGRPG